MNPNGLKVKGIFLDLDGTIVDSTEAYIEAAKIAFQAIGQIAPEKKALWKFQEDLSRVLQLTDITKGDSKKFLNVYLKTYYSIQQQKTKLMPNVSVTLESIS